MSQTTNYFFYLPPGVLKTNQLLDIYYNQTLSEFKNILIKINENESFALNPPNIQKEMLHWNACDYPQFYEKSESIFTMQIDENQPFIVNLDKLTFVSQSEEKLLKDSLPNIVLFRFKAGIFAREEDYQTNSISLEKVNVLHNSKRIAFEQAIKEKKERDDKFESLRTQQFNDLYEKFKFFDETRRNERIKLFNENQKKHVGYPVSPFLNQSTDPISFQQNQQINDQTTKDIVEPVIFEQNLETNVSFPLKPTDKSPTDKEVALFLKELVPLFPIDEQAQTFCGIKQNDPDLNAQKMLCFNLCHYLVLFAVISGQTYDYRFSISDGYWKIEDRITGSEIKRDLMTKANLFDNPYRDAIFSCLRKLCDDFNIPKCESLIAMIQSLNNYADLLLNRANSH